MNYFNYYLDAFRKYATFNGRASRAEYWYFVLFNVIISIVVEVIASGIKISVISTLYFLAVLVPSTAIASRRLHDIGKSFYWLLIALIPIIGTIWIIVLLAKKGNTGDNKYGSDPKVAQA